MRKLILLVTLTLSVSGCGSGLVADKSLEALCQDTKGPRKQHGMVLAEAKDPGVILSGSRLLRMLDGGCKPYGG